MTKDEALAMDLALEALTVLLDEWTPARQAQLKGMEAVTAIKQARSAPVQEPVAFFDWYDNAHWGNEDFKEGCHRSWNAAIKYTTPPAAQRQWVGLTDDSVVSAAARVLSDRVAASCNVDCGDMWMLHGNDSIEDARAMLEAAEAKLKEKNT